MFLTIRRDVTLIFTWPGSDFPHTIVFCHSMHLYKDVPIIHDCGVNSGCVNWAITSQTRMDARIRMGVSHDLENVAGLLNRYKHWIGGISSYIYHVRIPSNATTVHWKTTCVCGMRIIVWTVNDPFNSVRQYDISTQKLFLYSGPERTIVKTNQQKYLI